MEDMSVFVVVLLIVSSVFAVAYLCLMKVSYRSSDGYPSELLKWAYASETLLLTADLSAGGDVLIRVPLDMMLSLYVLMQIVSSVWKNKPSVMLAKIGMLVQILLAMCYFSIAAGLTRMHDFSWSVSACAVAALILLTSFLVSLSVRINDVKEVMSVGTVWKSLNLALDSVYMIFAVAYAITFSVLSHILPHADWYAAIVSLLLGAETMAIGIRAATDSLFVIRSRHERRIMESMKISQVEVVNDGYKEDDHYREIYDRVVEYFEEHKPYLNNDLTINDVVKVVYTNKLYISRAISQYTGRNFCQFVNYYRVTHSVKVFRKNPEMKVQELANACGFNSVVSFNMAFRLFMNENPSDWCRKERFRYLNGKNKLWNR